jgi:hypothetical protein
MLYREVQDIAAHQIRRDRERAEAAAAAAVAGGAAAIAASTRPAAARKAPEFRLNEHEEKVCGFSPFAFRLQRPFSHNNRGDL